MKILTAFLFLTFFTIQFSAQTMPEGFDPVLWQKALKIHKKAIVIDGHNDVTTPLLMPTSPSIATREEHSNPEEIRFTRI